MGLMDYIKPSDEDQDGSLPNQAEQAGEAAHDSDQPDQNGQAFGPPDDPNKVVFAESADDSTPSSGAAPMPDDGTLDDYNKLLVTPQDMRAAADQKRQNAFLGAMIDNLSNRQSVGNFMTGHMSPTQSSQGLVNALNQQADQPIEQKLAMLKQFQQKPQLELMAQMQDPKSVASQLSQATALSALSSMKAQNPEQAALMNQLRGQIHGSNATQINELVSSNPLLKDAFTSSIQGQRLAQMLAMTQARLNQTDKKIGIQEDNQANTAASGIDKDPKIIQYQGQLGQIGKAMGLLNQNGPIPNQTASELANDLATILNNGRAAGLEAANKQEYNSAEGALAQAKQWLTANPQNALPEKFKQQLRDQFVRLKQATAEQQAARATQLAVGRGYQHNPAAQAALDSKIQSYQVPDQGYQVQTAPAQQGESSSLIPSANASGPVFKMINGMKYQKVQGGWKKVE